MDPLNLSISWVGANPNIKIGGSSKKYIANGSEGALTWEFEIDGKNILSMLKVDCQDNYCLVSTENEDLANKVMTIRVTQDDGLMAELSVYFTYL